QPRSQFEIADGIDSAGSDVRRIGVVAEEELGAGEDQSDGAFDTAVEPALPSTSLIEAHQRLDVALRDRLAIRSPGQRREDLCRTCRFVGFSGPRIRPARPTHENPSAAWRVARASRVERAGNLQVLDQ